MAGDDTSVELTLAEHVANVGAVHLPLAASDAFDRLMFDFVCVMLAGYFDAGAKRISDVLAAASGRGKSSLIGRRVGVPAPAAAFGHGVLAHWFDWDDTHDESHVHGGAVIFPALIALVETQGASGRACTPGEFVAAAVAGYDVACRVGGYLKTHGPRGWMPTGSGATVCAAAAGARLLGLDSRGIVSAMGIAAANAGLSRQALADRTDGKGILAGIAAKTAVEAAMLAQAGVQGAPHFLTGIYGLQALHGASRGNPSEMLRGLGTNFSITEVGIKPYPCCRSTHAVLEAALSLRRARPDLADHVASVRAAVPAGVYERCGSPFIIGGNPRLAAQFSIPYTLALALRKGAPTLADFSSEAVIDNARAHAGLIGAIVVESETAPGADVMAPVTVQFSAAGEVFERRVVRVPGAPDALWPAKRRRRSSSPLPASISKQQSGKRSLI
jgi:2-methylcitrate dehydratase PrpD